jgi:exopolysaccharide biosynthesis polyprenyl glycosylphosphotransferase
VNTALSTAHADLGIVEAAIVESAVPTAVEERQSLRLSSAVSWALACLGVDAAMLALAVAATVAGAGAAGVEPSPGWLLAFAVLTVGLFSVRGLYGFRIGLHALDDIARIAAFTTLAAMALVTVRVLLGEEQIAAEAARPWAFAVVYLAAGRAALYWSQARARAHGEGARPTLIVGAGRIGSLAARRLVEHPEIGLRPVAFLDKEPLADPSQSLGIPVAGASWDLDAVVAEYGVEHVVVTFSTAPDEVLLRMVRRCEELGLGVSMVPRLFEKVPERLTVDHLGGLPLITVHPADPKSWHFTAKYALDRAAAALLVLLSLPVLGAAALAVRLTLGRPILFRQVRVGRDGRTFEMLKFRSMRVGDGELEPLPLADGVGPGGVEGEDRRTRLGAFLRATSIDELPQLFNVLRGEMSMIGPRPERPEYVSQFERSVYRYGERHRVRAGITGWAQVHGLRGKTSIADRAEWDNHYIENFSLWLDLKIALMTFASVFGYYRHVE